MKILHLPLKAQWYEMIERGEKTEEYREIKPYKPEWGAPTEDVFIIKLGKRL